MQRNVVRFAVMVAIVLVALASGIGLGFGLYELFKKTHGVSQQSMPQSTSTIRRALA